MAKILLYGEIGYDVMSKDVVEWLGANEGEQVEMHINSPGGDVFEALAIRSAMTNVAGLTVVVDALAASAAAVIALCGKPLKMSQYARLMIHSASTSAYGNSKQIQEQLSLLNGIDTSLADLIANAMGSDAKSVQKQYFDGQDHWLSADDCVKMGIATILEQNDPMASPTDKGLRVFDSINGLGAGVEVKDINTINKNMDKEKEGQKPQLTEAQVREMVDGLTSKYEAKITELNTKLKGYQDAEQARMDAEDKALLDAAVKDGRIAAETLDTFTALLKSDRENTIKVLNAIPVKKQETEVKKVTDFIDNGESPKSAWQDTYNRIMNRQ